MQEMSLPSSIKLIRQKSLLKQEEFAKKLNVDITTVNRWEIAKGAPDISAIKKIRAYCEKYDLAEKEWLSAGLGEK